MEEAQSNFDLTSLELVRAEREEAELIAKRRSEATTLEQPPPPASARGHRPRSVAAQS